MKLAALLLCAAACAVAQPHRANGLYAVFETSMGSFTAKLYEKDVPATVQNFVGLATGTIPWLDPETHKAVKRPLYSNITFHRIVPAEIIQSGDPSGTGSHPCGVHLDDEVLPGLQFDRGGVLAMANSGDPNSGGCQFFVTEGPMRVWNGKYTIFGLVVDGLPVVDKIAHVPVRDEKPLTPVKLIRVTIEREGPEPKVKPRKK